MDSQTLINLGLVLVFVVIGGIFAATELALVSLRESQLSALERRGERGARVADVARDPNRFLAAVQIGVTVAGFLSAAYGGSTLAPDLAPYLERLGLGPGAAETTALVALTLLIAYLSLVLGELVPKRLALQKPAGIALAVAPVLDRFATLMRPVIWLLSLSTNAVVRLLGGDPHATADKVTEEELRELVSTHHELEEQERQILRDVFTVTETTLAEVMKPRGDVTFLRGDIPLPEAAERVRTLPYSRYPVIGENFDDVLGFLHIRDLLGLPAADDLTVSDVARPILMLPGTKLVLPSVATMRESETHLAIVVDEYGGTDGIVTLEDLVEEVIGDIRDEYDAPESLRTAHDLTRVDAGTTIADVEEELGISLPEGGYQTLGGLIFAKLGRIPQAGESLTVGNTELEVVSMAGNRISEVAVRVIDPAEDTAAGSSPG
mgnify:CR=1 FL=1